LIIEEVIRIEDGLEKVRKEREDYIPPIRLIGYAINVLDVYNNNTWIRMENIKGEWYVVYHGVGRHENSENVQNIVRIFIKVALSTLHLENVQLMMI